MMTAKMVSLTHITFWTTFKKSEPWTVSFCFPLFILCCCIFCERRKIFFSYRLYIDEYWLCQHYQWYYIQFFFIPDASAVTVQYCDLYNTVNFFLCCQFFVISFQSEKDSKEEILKAFKLFDDDNTVSIKHLHTV